MQGLHFVNDVPVAVSKYMQAVKICSGNIFQFLTGDAR